MTEVAVKSFYRKSRKGQVQRILRDTYLQRESVLGYGFLHNTPLSIDQLVQLVREAPHKQLLFIDTNVALHQIDVLEYTCPGMALVVILQTVLQELRHLNLAAYHRITQLLKVETKSFIFYPNETSESTAVLRLEHETINDFNDRAIRESALFFSRSLAQNHQVSQGPGESGGSEAIVVLITNDKENARLAATSGLATYAMRAYVDTYLFKYPELLDLVANDHVLLTANATASSTKSYFPLHLSAIEVTKRLQARSLVKGTIRCKNNTRNDCYVIMHSDDKKAPRKVVMIRGAAAVNRALDGDVVAVEITTVLSTDDSVHKAIVPAVGAGDVSTSTAGAIDVCAEPSIESVEGLPASNPTENEVVGVVVGIISRKWRQYAGSLDPSSVQYTNDVATVVFIPMDAKIPSVMIHTRRLEELVNMRIIVAIDTWPASSELPLGHFIRCLGSADEKEVETQALLHEFNVSSQSFSTAVMACLPPATWTISPELVASRTDLRHLPICSIDPPGCKDIDDALHCVTLPNGNVQIGVHIADVTYFVHPDSAIDKEAAYRSTSTYLVERRLDMLPSLLTTDLCSLRSSEDHLAFSVVWEMDAQGDILTVEFFKSVIRSKASLTYEQAQDMLDSPADVNSGSSSDVINISVNMLNKYAKIFRQRRIDTGALTLASPEVRFKLDQETNNPTDVGMYQLRDSNALVEEFMLLANITVAKKVLRHFPTLAVLRRHQPPSREQFTSLLSAAAAVGVDIDISTSKTLADSLDLAVRPEDPYFNKLLRILSTRCMMPAQYFCSGEIPKDQWHHYGLAAPVYTHFTSPIRRYADVIVHRLLAAAIGVIPLPIANADRTRQQDLCSHMNRRHRAAQYVQRASVNMHTLLYFKNRPCDEEAYVSTVQKGNVTVLVPRFGIEGAVDLEVLATQLNARLEFDSDAHRVTVTAGDWSVLHSLQVFQKVRVHIVAVEGAGGARRLVIALASGGGGDEVEDGAMDLIDEEGQRARSNKPSDAADAAAERKSKPLLKRKASAGLKSIKQLRRGA